MDWKYRKTRKNDGLKATDPVISSRHDSLMDHDENRKMFNYIAPYYDKTNVILSLGQDRYWRKQAIKKLMESKPGLILDVGAGTGDIGMNIVHGHPDSMVVGIDTSMEMMRVGIRKTRNMGVDQRVIFCPANVLELCFPDGVFDAAITSFCIRNVDDRFRALTEMFRVMKRGAHLVIVELTQPQGFLMKPLFSIYSNIITPTITRFFSSASAYDYLTESMADFPDPDEFSAMLRSVGFAGISYFHLTFGIVTIYVATKP